MSNKVDPVEDPLAPDAPIHHLLSISSNPNVATMSTEELTALVQRLRTYATSPQALTAKVAADSSNVTTRKRNPIAAKRKALLESL